MKQIGKFQVEDKPLARGGMGQIFKGYDEAGNVVAIKEILPEFATDYSIVSRIQKEVEFLLKINHEYIVKFHDAFPNPETQSYYIVMEFVEGLNVEQYVAKNGPIPYKEAMEIMMKVLEGLQFVHDSGIVHRDIKPSNIMILPDMSVRLLDFGVAKDMTTPGVMTIVGSVIGTTGYMSPEQAEGYSINYQSDIYSLGCVFFYMLTGHHAFNTLASEHQTKEAILKDKFPRLKSFMREIPAEYREDLQRILDRATDRNMFSRYQNAIEFQNDLRRLYSKIINGTKGDPDPHGVYITVGRENCDIIIQDESSKISRHHLDIELKEFTGGKYFVLTDVSSNGTRVGNRLIRRESVSIPATGNLPEVRLANSDSGLLDWEEVKRKVGGRRAGPPPVPSGVSDAGEDGTILMILAYVFAILGGIPGIVFGLVLATAKVTLPDGRRVYKYKKMSRQCGWGAFILSILAMIGYILILQF